MNDPKLLIFGAHPDDAELNAGGLMKRYRDRGWPVKVISATNGESGHQSRHGPELAQCRDAELKASCGVIGAEAETWPFRDGFLQSTLELRHRIIAEIRTYKPDLVLTHRTIDYHPDHRALALAVQDAAYLVTVPAVVPEAPFLRVDPVIAFMADHFTRPAPFQPDVICEVKDLDTLVEMMHCHASQVYEWLPFNWRIEGTVPPPDDVAGRKAFVRERIWEPRWKHYSDWLRPAMIKCWGAERANQVIYAEAFEIAEHGSTLSDEARIRLFPE